MSNYISFSVRNQIIKRTDKFDVVADSQNYLHAKFDFETDEWDGLIKTALFRKGKTGTVYEMILANDECLVPHEVLVGSDGHIYVSVFAGELITVNVASVFVQHSGYWSDAESSTPPTPSVYEQIIDRLDGVEETVIESAETAEAYAVGTREGIEVGPGDPAYDNNAKFYAEKAEQSASESGFMFFTNENGRLYFNRTDNVDIDFALEEGRLVYYGD